MKITIGLFLLSMTLAFSGCQSAQHSPESTQSIDASALSDVVETSTKT